MTHHRSILGGFAAVMVTGFCLAPAERLAAEKARSLTEQEIEVSEAKTALDILVKENDRLKAQLEQTDAVLAETQKNLSNAMSEAEEFRRKASEFKQRLEALGLEGAGGNLDKLQQRLLRAVSDLKIAEDDRKKLKEALIQLSETVMSFKQVAVTNDPAAIEAIEVAMRNTAKALGVALSDAREVPATAATLQDGMVLSLKEELALIVLNLGSSQGVKVGMPFKVLRGDDVIGTVRVVDVRERIAGAVIQNLSSDKEKIKQGDRLKVDAQQ